VNGAEREVEYDGERGVGRDGGRVVCGGQTEAVVAVMGACIGGVGADEGRVASEIVGV
jgi:hypothetical protein